SARCAGIASIHLELRAGNEAARRFYRAMGFYETVLVPGYYRSGEGRKEGALRMLRVLRVPGPLPAAWRPPRLEDREQTFTAVRSSGAEPEPPTLATERSSGAVPELLRHARRSDAQP